MSDAPDIESRIQGTLNAHLAAFRPVMGTAHENVTFLPPDPEQGSTAQVSTVEFTDRTPDLGDIYQVAVNGNNVAVFAEAAETLPQLLTRLAGLILGAQYVAGVKRIIRITGTADGAPFILAASATTSLGGAITGAFPANPIQEVTPAFIGNMWLEPVLIPAKSSNSSIGTGGVVRHLGIFQINVRYPLGKGWGVPKLMAGRLATHYKGAQILIDDELRIHMEQAWPGPAFRDNGWYCVPVSISYRAEG